MHSTVDRDADIRARIQEHWDASERGDFDAEHAIYAAEAVLDYPQSGERFEAGQRSKPSAAGTPPTAISPSAASWAVVISG